MVGVVLKNLTPDTRVFLFCAASRDFSKVLILMQTIVCCLVRQHLLLLGRSGSGPASVP